MRKDLFSMDNEESKMVKAWPVTKTDLTDAIRKQKCSISPEERKKYIEWQEDQEGMEDE